MTPATKCERCDGASPTEDDLCDHCRGQQPIPESMLWLRWLEAEMLIGNNPFA